MDSLHDYTMFQEEDADVTNANLSIDPPVEWHVVQALYEKFASIMRNLCDAHLLDQASRSVTDMQIGRAHV